MAHIDTLVDDIQGLFGETPFEANPERVRKLGEVIADVVASRLAEGPRKPTLRMSNLGKGDRQIWYELHSTEREALEPEAKMKFLFGDIWEAILLFLARESGHEVEHEQAELMLNGIMGHTDAVIDGVVVDVKSASKYGFSKFKDGSLRENDSFGYMEQLAGYSTAFGGLDGAFLAVEKERANMALMKVPAEELAVYNIEERIDHLKEVVKSDEPPERCYEDVEHGKSGNRKLGVNCSYCPFKFTCWADANDGAGLRTFIYSGGPVHMTQVEKQPEVYEATSWPVKE